MKNLFNVADTEEEQLQRIKAWWKDNAIAIVSGIAIAAVAVGGWRWYESHLHTQQTQARTLYLKLLDEGVDSETVFNQLTQDYQSSSYLEFAKLLKAKIDYEDKNYDGALELLLELIGEDDSFITHIARLRAANVLLAKQDYQEAERIINNVTDEQTFTAQYEMLRGDIRYFQNDAAAAKKYYETALQNTQNNQIAAILRLKINDLN